MIKPVWPVMCGFCGNRLMLPLEHAPVQNEANWYHTNGIDKRIEQEGWERVVTTPDDFEVEKGYEPAICPRCINWLRREQP